MSQKKYPRDNELILTQIFSFLTIPQIAALVLLP
jgi:hypothetical protein